MLITPSPMRNDAVLALFRSGETLTLNGQIIDLSGAQPETPLLWLPPLMQDVSDLLE